MSRSKILFFVSGSIAGFKAAQVVSMLVKAGHDVQCVASASALKFVGAATYEGLTGKPVITDLWAEGHAMDHIHLSRWADFGVVCPASANTIARMALGLADEIVSATLLAWPKEKPLFVFPAMNTAMWSAEATQSHVATLRRRGVRVAETGTGSLACGEEGAGRLLEPDDVIAQIFAQTAKRKVLITGGATREFIDGIRFVSNISTGRTAAELCEAFAGLGCDVTYLHGTQAMKPRSPARSYEFLNYEDLSETLHEVLAADDFDAIIHCAAVSDYTIATVNGGQPNAGLKISSGDSLSLTFKPTTKILPLIKEYSRNKNTRVIGFKLTLNADERTRTAAAEAVLKDNVDAVVVNDWAEVKRDRDRHPGYLLTRDHRADFGSTGEMAKLIFEFIRKDEP